MARLDIAYDAKVASDLNIIDFQVANDSEVIAGIDRRRCQPIPDHCI